LEQKHPNMKLLYPQKSQLTKAIAFLLFSQFFINCGNQNTPKNLPEDPKNLLHYTILEDTLTQMPSKVQIMTTIVINDPKDSITAAKLENTLNHLYNERINRTGFEYLDHPNSIGIYAYLSKERAESGFGQWIAMIAKMPMDSVAQVSFNQAGLHSLKEKEITKWNVSYMKRQQIWERMIFADREANAEAENSIPLNGATEADLGRNARLSYRLKTEKETKIIRDYRISKDVLDSIEMEGVGCDWGFPRK